MQPAVTRNQLNFKQKLKDNIVVYSAMDVRGFPLRKQLDDKEDKQSITLPTHTHVWKRKTDC